MNTKRLEIIRRKQCLTEEKPAKKIIIDILKSSAIIADNFTGQVVLNFNQGGITGYEKVEKGIF